MTLTLLRDVLISLVLAVVADRIGRRRMLAFGSLLMIGSGVVFAPCTNYWVLLAASVFDVITPRYTSSVLSSQRSDVEVVVTISAFSRLLRSLYYPNSYL